MYEFKIQATDKTELYRQLVEAADALTAGEPDDIANMANVAALLARGCSSAGLLLQPMETHTRPNSRALLTLSACITAPPSGRRLWLPSPCFACASRVQHLE